MNIIWGIVVSDKDLYGIQPAAYKETVAARIDTDNKRAPSGAAVWLRLPGTVLLTGSNAAYQETCKESLATTLHKDGGIGSLRKQAVMKMIANQPDASQCIAAGQWVSGSRVAENYESTSSGLAIGGTPERLWVTIMNRQAQMDVAFCQASQGVGCKPCGFAIGHRTILTVKQRGKPVLGSLLVGPSVKDGLVGIAAIYSGASETAGCQ